MGEEEGRGGGIVGHLLWSHKEEGRSNDWRGTILGFQIRPPRNVDGLVTTADAQIARVGHIGAVKKLRKR